MRASSAGEISERVLQLIPCIAGKEITTLEFKMSLRCAARQCTAENLLFPCYIGYLEFKVSLSSAVVLIVAAYMATASVAGETSAKQKSCHA